MHGLLVREKKKVGVERMKKKERLNYNIIFVLFLMLCASVIAIYSAQQTHQYPTNFAVRQVMWYGVGAVIIALAMIPDTEQMDKLTWYFYWLNIAILVLLVVSPEAIAPKKNDAKSWFVLPGVGSIQPSEFMKVGLILALSKVITKHNETFKLRNFNTDLKLLWKMAFTTLLPILLVMLQPDLGTALVIMFIFTVMLFMSGVTWKLITGLYGIIGTIGASILYMVLYHPKILSTYLHVSQYQFNRIYAWLDPESYKASLSYNYMQAVTAIGSGRMNGNGFFRDHVLYVPEKHSDFIFSAIGESFGFIGGSIVISLFMLLVYNIVIVASNTKEPFQSYICAGIIAMITFHVFENVGMDIGVLPITGIPLPFISYGGSSLMSSMLAMGIILKISYESNQYMFD